MRVKAHQPQKKPVILFHRIDNAKCMAHRKRLVDEEVGMSQTCCNSDHSLPTSLERRIMEREAPPTTRPQEHGSLLNSVLGLPLCKSSSSFDHDDGSVSLTNMQSSHGGGVLLAQERPTTARFD